MGNINIFQKINKSKIISVIRAECSEECKEIVDAVVSAGIKIIEITMTVPRAIKIIEEIKDKYRNSDTTIGAGTVNDGTTAMECISAGAEFIVSPIFDKETGKICNSKDILYIPGAFTPNEIFNCVKEGFKLIKIFPASWIGPNKLKELKGPFPQLELLPTGGVTVENIKEWFRGGAFAVAVGSAITKYAKDKNYDKVNERAKEFLRAIN